MVEAAYALGIIGTGNMGHALGRRWACGGHEVLFGSRDPAIPGEVVEAVLFSSVSRASAWALESSTASSMNFSKNSVRDIK
jgi:predicted dinucleotide-binding enzyme